MDEPFDKAQDEQRIALLKEFKELKNTGYESWLKAHELYNQAFKLWLEGGYTDLRSSPNSVFFQQVLNEFSRFPQIIHERGKND